MTGTLPDFETYFQEWLPTRLSETELGLLSAVGVPTRIAIRHGEDCREWTILAAEGGLRLVAGLEPACAFEMSADTFGDIITARLSPKKAFFSQRLRLRGSVFLALKVGRILEEVFQRIPYAEAPRPPSPNRAPDQRHEQALTPHQKKVLRLHLDPSEGSPYWIGRSQALGVRAEELESTSDLWRFGLMERSALTTRPYRDFLPAATRRAGGGIILGESGGATGAPVISPWTPREFEAAFIAPFLGELHARGIAGLRQWLFVGPGGPHIIGQAAREIAHSTTGTDVLTVDFDPRWHRRLLPGSAGAARHLEHVIRQTRLIVSKEPVDALFITPSVLQQLLGSGGTAWSDGLRVVHLGGQSMSMAERAALEEMLPAGCEVINGYGNSLFGVLVEHDREQPLTYQAPHDRYTISLVDAADPRAEVGAGEWGRVLASRFDESMLVLNLLERDEALRTAGGLHSPQPATETATTVAGGIY